MQCVAESVRKIYRRNEKKIRRVSCVMDLCYGCCIAFKRNSFLFLITFSHAFISVFTSSRFTKAPADSSPVMIHPTGRALTEIKST